MTDTTDDDDEPPFDNEDTMRLSPTFTPRVAQELIKWPTDKLEALRQRVTDEIANQTQLLDAVTAELERRQP